MSSDAAQDEIITPSGIQIEADLYAKLSEKFRSRCCIPRCNAPLFDFYIMTDNSNDVLTLDSYLAVCRTHSKVSAKLKSVFRSVRNLVALTPGSPSKMLASRKELLEELVYQLSETECELRVNYVGPLFCHPSWYHERRDEAEGNAPNFDVAFHEYLMNSNHGSATTKVVLRNAKRYLEKVSALVLPNERESFKRSILQEVGNIWGEEGEKGPSIMCIEMGSFRHPMIFDDAVIEIVRDAPERPAIRGVVFSDSDYVNWERSNFDRVFEYSHRGQQRELAALREFVTGLWA